MRTISSLHPCTFILAAFQLDRLPTFVAGMEICVTVWFGKLFVPVAQPRKRV